MQIFKLDASLVVTPANNIDKHGELINEEDIAEALFYGISEKIVQNEKEEQPSVEFDHLLGIRWLNRPTTPAISFISSKKLASLSEEQEDSIFDDDEEDEENLGNKVDELRPI